jgi:hypothetical protein
VTATGPPMPAGLRERVFQASRRARAKSSASVDAAASIRAARPGSPVMCRSSRSGPVRLATSRQNPTASVTIATAAGAGGPSPPIGMSQVPPPGPVRTRCTMAGSYRPLRVAACGSSRAASKVIRLSVDGSGTDDGSPAAWRMSLSWIHSSNARTTSSMPSGCRMPCTATSAPVSSAARTRSRVRSAARRHSARVSAGGRPAWRSAADWVDST